jgi:protein-tyrosine phosphatase
MIDLHCHLLPGIDDGPDTMEEAVAMARAAHEAGIHKAVVTPHLHLGRYDNNLQSIRAAAEAFATELRRADIPLEIGYGAEVRISPELTNLIECDQVPFLGELDARRVMLLELPHGHIPVGSDKMVEWLLMRNIVPMIAHPERNKDIMRRLDKILPFVELGCLLQVTAGSIVGQFGPRALQRANELLERGWVHVIASDAHNLCARCPDLEAGRAAAERIVGEAPSWALVHDTPLEISRGRFLSANVAAQGPMRHQPLCS